MNNLDKRLTALEVDKSTNTQDRPQTPVIVYNHVTGQELTPRPAGASVLVFMPHNYRDQIPTGKLAGNITDAKASKDNLVP